LGLVLTTSLITCWPPIALNSFTPCFSTPGGDPPALVMGRIGASWAASTEAATMTGTSEVMIGLETSNSFGNRSDSRASSVGDTSPWVRNRHRSPYKNSRGESTLRSSTEGRAQASAGLNVRLCFLLDHGGIQRVRIANSSVSTTENSRAAGIFSRALSEAWQPPAPS
jgi:hypothetical protein